MTRKEALALLQNAWCLWKPGKSYTDDDGWHRDDIFDGVQVTCTRDEWEAAMEALHKGETMKHEDEKCEQEQQNTASQEIEVARRELAKQVNEQLETHRGIKDLVILATALEKIR